MADVTKEVVKQINHYRKQWPVVVLVLVIMAAALWYQEREVGKLVASYDAQMDKLVELIVQKDTQYYKCQEEMLATLKEMEIHLQAIATR